jgi:hypothetical protein
MKGVLFDVVGDIVCSEYSVTTWDHILQSAGVDGAYTSLGNYPDEELFAIVAAASAATAMPPSDLLRWLGQRAFPLLVAHVPHVIDQIDSWQRMLTDVDAIVHVEVVRMYPDALVPAFSATLTDTGVELHYASRRGLCALAEGLILGVGEWYGTPLNVRQSECSHRGAPECIFHVEAST